MNPTLSGYQSLLINSSTNESDLQILLDSCEEYMIGKDETSTIIKDELRGVGKWGGIAVGLGISKREIDMFAQVYNRWADFL